MKKYLLICFSLAALLFSSCLRDNNTTGPDKPLKEGFKLNVSVVKPTGNTITRSEVPSIPGENDIHSLYIMFFEQTKDASGKYINYYQVPIREGECLNVVDPININFDASSGLYNSISYNMLVVANLDWYLNGRTPEQFFKEFEDCTESHVLDNAWAEVLGTPNTQSDNETPRIAHDKLLMSTKAVKVAGEDKVDIILLRSVSRFDVKNIAEDHILVSASIWNGYPSVPVWNDGRNDFTRKRLERFYGVDSEEDDTNEDLRKDIIGRLYSFENFVSTPELNDKTTTCLIVGLKSINDDKIYYHRINIHPEGSSQNLKRNKVYSVTVRSVNGLGENSELNAYTSDKTLIDLNINYWDLDDDGIVQFDGKNVLALPAKKATLSPEGEKREYSIFTMGESTLSISKKVLDNGITAMLNGNTLVIEGAPMNPDDEDKKGSVEIAYGGLRATIDIIQSRSTLQFIELSVYTVPSFPAMAGAGMLEPIKVKSSGPWKAKIYNGVFTFVGGADVPERNGNNGDTFTISTYEENKDDKVNDIKAEDRYAFVTVYLADNDEVNRTIILKQRKPSELTVLPEQSVVRFTPMGNLQVSRDVSTNVFTVNAGENGDDNDPQLNEWKVDLVAGGDAAMFKIENEHHTQVIADVEQNTFTIAAKGRNTSNRTYSAAVAVTLPGQTIRYVINVYQLPHEIVFSPDPNNPNNNPPIKPIGGGLTLDVNEKWDEPITWSAKVVSTIEGQEAYFVDGDEHKSELTGKSLNDKLTVKFPPMIIPYITPTATVTVTIDGTDVSTTFEIKQRTLTPRSIVYMGYNTGYGSPNATVGGTYYRNMGYVSDYLKNTDYFGAYGTVKTADALSLVGDGYSSSTLTSRNPGLYIANRCGASAARTALNTWIKGNDKNFAVICFRYNYAEAMAQLSLMKTGTASTTTPFAQANNAMAAGSVFTPVSAKEYCDTRNIGKEIWKYLLESGPFGPVDITKVEFKNYSDEVHCFTAHPVSTIPIIKHPSTGNPVVAIDPGMKVLMIGAQDIFGYAGTSPYHQQIENGSDTQKFLLNLLSYVVNSSQYGKDFYERFE